jgi:hypothetical protein
LNVSTLIVTQALVQHQDGVSLHPDLLLWEKQLSSYKQQWFDCADKNPLGWYAALCETSPTALLAEKCAVPADTSQCWIASPYHAQVQRGSVSVFPEGLFPWSPEDATYLCELLNPLLAEEGMLLLVADSALLLACQEPINAYPAGFGAVSGKALPDRHHEGEDGGRLNRLLSEIQMLLFQHPSVARHDRGELDVNGIWLWAPLDWPGASEAKQFSVATRNPALQSLTDGRDAKLIISEVERLAELIQQQGVLPKKIVLAGEGYAVLLTKSLLPRLGKIGWVPKSAGSEAELLARMQSLQVGKL